MANKNIVAEKEKEVESIVEKLNSAKSVVLVDYRGLNVEQATELRSDCRKENVEYKVIKNSLLLRAFEKVGLSGYEKIFEGPTAVAFSYDDPVPGAKILAAMAEKTKILEVKGGVIGGKNATAKDIKVLATVPPKPVLLSQLLGLLTSPMRSFAVAISEVAKKKSA